MVDIHGLQKRTSQMSVLYVEDDLEVQENTKIIFEDLFLDVKTANNGQEALEIYKQGNYDIVITDVNMPNMNGIELIKEIKKIDITQVVIIISAHNETEYFIDGIQSGIDGYILKPIDFEQLFVTLHKVTLIIQQKKENIEYKFYMEELVKEKTKDLEKNYNEMRLLLAADKTTSLPNANMLYQYLDLYHKDDISICIFKIDNCNFLSQTYSHEICEQIVQNCACFLQLNFPPEATMYRYSEEDFVVVFEEGTKQELIELATQINALFKETPVAKNVEEKDIYITVSCGIVHQQPPYNILRKARMVLNELSKLKMVGHFNVYDEDAYFMKELKTENQWFEKIREIIEEDHVVPYFHPIVSNETHEVIRYECLVRIDDEGEIIAPADFLESIKKAGLIENLSIIMINKCFKLFSKTNINFSINITNEDLLNEKFADFVIAKQQQYAIEPTQVMFEILENVILDKNYKAPLANLAKLKKHGFLLALDDFGSDRFNLSRLVSVLDLDYIKIDGQFIKGIDKNETNLKIVETVVELSKKLHIKVVAEYVSTKEEYEIIKKLGIDFSQGYYFFRPEKETVKCDIV